MSAKCSLLVLGSLLSSLVAGTPLLNPTPSAQHGGAVLPLVRRNIASRAGVVGGSIGLGDLRDVAYFVSVTIGNFTVPLHLVTNAIDLEVISVACQKDGCRNYTGPAYDTSQTFQSFGPAVSYDPDTDSTARIGSDTVTVAGLTLKDQAIAAIDNASDPIYYGAAGSFGLGFPFNSTIQAIAMNQTLHISTSDSNPDTWFQEVPTLGPIIPRLVLSGALEEPLFAITLQREVIDVSGSGNLTIGKLPAGVDNSSITWIPVRLYNATESGITPPSFAPGEKYPVNWEIDLDAVFLDGEQLPPPKQKKSRHTAIISTGVLSVMWGPPDVTDAIFTKVSPSYAKDHSSRPTLPCAAAHNLTFQFGGKAFPVDARDFLSPDLTTNDTTTCNVEVIDSSFLLDNQPYTWILNEPFLRGNLVAFYYGNITHPSVDPPRIGLLSLVPQNSGQLLDDAVSKAQNGAGFSATQQFAPTQSSVVTGTPAAKNGALAKRDASQVTVSLLIAVFGLFSAGSLF